MLLVIDIGNSSVSCGVFEVDSVKNTYMLHYDFRITTKVMSSDEYALLINNFLLQLHLFLIFYQWDIFSKK